MLVHLHVSKTCIRDITQASVHNAVDAQLHLVPPELLMDLNVNATFVMECAGGCLVVSDKEHASVHQLMAEDAQSNLRVWQVCLFCCAHVPVVAGRDLKLLLL